LTMFYDTEMKILTEQLQEVKTVYGDIQPYDRNISFEEGIEIEITKRAFCDIEPLIGKDSYISIKENLFKVMKIKTWSDYTELWLYECNR